jgi:hypothetical protein
LSLGHLDFVQKMQINPVGRMHLVNVVKDADIRDAFGPDVERIVRENSDSITDSKDKKAPWRERKERYIAAISHKSESALLVSV